MLVYLRNHLILIISIILGCLLVSCSRSDQAKIQTAVAPVLSTAASDAGKYAQTQAVELGKTAVASAGTETVNLRKTAVAVASTQAAQILTPQPPKFGYDSNPRDIILYNVVREVSLAEIAFKFSVPSEQLIVLNKERYPSLTGEQSKLQPNWRLVLYVGSPDHVDLIPNNDDAWNNLAGCLNSKEPVISVISCNEYSLVIASEKGVNIGCVSLDGNPLGYYVVHSKYEGLMLYYSGKPFIYSLYFDEEKNTVVIGPAIIKSKQNLPECGIPGNP